MKQSAILAGIILIGSLTLMSSVEARASEAVQQVTPIPIEILVEEQRMIGPNLLETEMTSANQITKNNQRVADFAVQFIGNPYVYGGTSLTNGADCSGFIQSVYKNFDIQLPRTSWEQRSVGTEVAGIAEALPGDIIAYQGHVGIYIGNGNIVHAATTKDGITISPVTYKPIISVRRLS